MAPLRRRATSAPESGASEHRRNATVRYVGGVLLLLLLGIAAEILGHLFLSGESVWQTLVIGFGEAFLISAVLATLVDPFIKSRIQAESAWGGIFNFLNSRAPEGLKDAIRDLADCKVFYPETIWTLGFEWHNPTDGILSLTIEIRSTGRNISRHPYLLDRKAWVLASTTGYQSEYLRYAVSCPGDIVAIDAAGEDLRQHITTLADGSITVDEAGLSGGQEIPAGKTFDMVKRARMYRHSNGYIPLHHGKFGENLEIRLTGGAIEDIDVRVSHPRFDGQANLTERRRPAASATEPGSVRFQRVTPGQTTIVSWRPAAREAAPERIDLPANAMPDDSRL